MVYYCWLEIGERKARRMIVLAAVGTDRNLSVLRFLAASQRHCKAFGDILFKMSAPCSAFIVATVHPRP